MRAFVADALGARYRVSTAADGAEGLAAVRAGAFDLVVSDLMMPGTSGDRLVAAMREDAALDAVPVMLLSARADDAMRLQLLEGGAQDYLTKPFAAAELLARAGNLVQAKRAGDALRGALGTLSGDLADLARRITGKNAQLEAALQAAVDARARAEAAGRAKGDFLGMVSHELRSPLTTLQLNLDLLARDASLAEAVQARIARLVRANAQMTGLVESLLEYARADDARQAPRWAEVDVTALAQEVLAPLREQAPAAVDVRVEAPPALVLRTDPDLLRMVLANLLGNALKFTREGHVRLRVAQAADDCLFEVEDTGPGIPAADLDRIFEPFEQVGPVRSKSVPGVGLGLALARRAVQALGGRIEVRSTVGAGSVFRVSLPRGDA